MFLEAAIESGRRQMWMVSPIFKAIVFLVLCMSSPAKAQFSDATGGDGSLERFVIEEEEYGWVIASSNWWRSPQINVCWESLEPEYASQRGVVQNAIEQTWEQASALDFNGWEQQCPPINFAGIRIAVDDDVPHVKRYGRHLSSVPSGMVLNFEFLNYSTKACAAVEKREGCIWTTAVHEFGHAIGFVHEQNHPDRILYESLTGTTCANDAVGEGTSGQIMLTDYDPDSVMNYCNQNMNYGHLTQRDILAVQSMYGVGNAE